MSSEQVRVAILGGGPAALSAAHHLTSREPGRYRITIYEQSFRLGGKTASGRGDHDRIEEHGLHILFGAYHNAFATMVDCYDSFDEPVAGEEGRRAVEPGEHRFRHFLEAVEPRHFGVIGDDRDGPGKWRPWFWQFPCNRAAPGEPPLPTTLGVCLTLTQLVIHALFGAPGLRLFQKIMGPCIGYGRRLPTRKRPSWREQAASSPGDVPRPRQPKGFLPPLWFFLVGAFLDRQNVRGRLAYASLRLGHWLWGGWRALAHLPGVRRTFVGVGWTMGDFAFALARGIIVHGLLVRSRRRRENRGKPEYESEWGYYDRIDHLDFRQWLERHGAHARTRQAPIVRTVYDAAFSYRDGDPRQESMGAGTVLRIMAIMGFTYKTAMYFKMKAGMGDVISAPLYRVLRARGVRFEFFHRVKDVVPGDSGLVETIEIDRLVESDYPEPVASRRGVLSWPSRPRREPFASDAEYDDACHADRYYHRPRTTPRRVRLCRGRDFDRVVFAIPVRAIPYVAPSLLTPAAEPGDEWRRELWRNQTRVEAVQTMALQLWFRPTLVELGWEGPPPLLSLYYDPLNTYCSMDQTLGSEAGWPVGAQPGHVAYFCGALRHRPEHEPPPVDLYRAGPSSELDDYVASLAASLRREIEEEAHAHLGRLGELFPKTGRPVADGGAGFNYGLLLDPSHASGPARLGAQYLRANHEPWERCTLALPTTTRHRMRAGATGYDNLVVAGDWTANGLNAACFEGAIVSGIQAARAVSGRDDLYPIAGERLLNMEPLEPLGPREAARG